jgi:hypothetical protein
MAIQTVRGEGMHVAPIAALKLRAEAAFLTSTTDTQDQQFALGGSSWAMTGECAASVLAVQPYQEYAIDCYLICKSAKCITVSAGRSTVNAITYLVGLPGLLFGERGTSLCLDTQQEYLGLSSCGPTGFKALALANPLLATNFSPSLRFHPDSAPSGDTDFQREVQFEVEYQKLGWVRGMYGAQPAQSESRAFWLRQGESGAAWLIVKLRQETRVEVLDAVAALFRKMDKGAVTPILAELDGQPVPEIAEALIRGLRRERLAEDAGPSYSRILSILERFSEHDAAEVREAAYETATRLRKEDARQFFDRAQKHEIDSELSELIRELRE